MGLFKDDDEVGTPNGENGNINGFDDTNVDTDLLSQIFAGGGDNFSIDSGDDQLDLDDDVLSDASPVEESDNVGEISDETIESLAGEIPKETLESITGDIPEETMEPVLDEVPEEVAESLKDEAEDSLVDMPSEDEVSEMEDVPEEADEAKASDALSSDDTIISNIMDDVVNEEAQAAMEEERANGTITVITENTTINGSISSDGSLEVMGVITGDIECLGKVYINGTVSGGVIASEIFVNTPKLTGGLQSEGTVKIGVGTMIIGDISGTSAYIAGAVKGNIDIDGPVVIESTAIVKGDIKARSITINAGAVVDGYCSLNYASVDLDKFFEED